MEFDDVADVKDIESECYDQNSREKTREFV